MTTDAPPSCCSCCPAEKCLLLEDQKAVKGSSPDDGSNDPRFPWMAKSSFVSYCGALVCAPDGEHWGAPCHFDTARTESKTRDLQLVVTAAKLVYGAVSRA